MDGRGDPTVERVRNTTSYRKRYVVGLFRKIFRSVKNGEESRFGTFRRVGTVLFENSNKREGGERGENEVTTV